MTPEERQMITGLFDRMRSYGTPQKDREAEAVINEGVRSTPDAGYMLVQSVLVQEHALKEAGNRIEDLEEQVRNLRNAGQERTPESGSFLGGLFGGGRPASQPGPGSVPVIGSRAPAPSAFDQDQQRPWSQSPPQQAAAPAPAGGGFLRSAMATAAGVAGGMLAAGAIRDLMGGTANSNNANTNAPAATNASSGTDTASTETASAEQAQQDQEQDALQDASDDDSSWGDGGDLDI